MSITDLRIRPGTAYSCSVTSRCVSTSGTSTCRHPQPTTQYNKTNLSSTSTCIKRQPGHDADNRHMMQIKIIMSDIPLNGRLSFTA